MSSSVAVDSNIGLTSTGQTDGNGGLRELTMEEVRKAVTVKRLKNGKARGDDGIVAELLKYGGEVEINWLFEVVTEVWMEKKVPEDWKNPL